MVDLLLGRKMRSLVVALMLEVGLLLMLIEDGWIVRGPGRSRAEGRRVEGSLLRLRRLLVHGRDPSKSGVPANRRRGHAKQVAARKLRMLLTRVHRTRPLLLGRRLGEPERVLLVTVRRRAGRMPRQMMRNLGVMVPRAGGLLTCRAPGVRHRLLRLAMLLLLFRKDAVFARRKHWVSVEERSGRHGRRATIVIQLARLLFEQLIGVLDPLSLVLWLLLRGWRLSMLLGVRQVRRQRGRRPSQERPLSVADPEDQGLERLERSVGLALYEEIVPEEGSLVPLLHLERSEGTLDGPGRVAVLPGNALDRLG